MTKIKDTLHKKKDGIEEGWKICERCGKVFWYREGDEEAICECEKKIRELKEGWKGGHHGDSG
jgi:hypothetical protein